MSGSSRWCRRPSPARRGRIRGDTTGGATSRGADPSSLLLPDLLRERVAADDALDAFRSRQTDPERGARAAGTLAHAHLASVQLHETLRQVETKPQPVLHTL